MRDFLKYTLASLTGSVLFFILFITFAAIGSIGLIGALIASLGSSEEVSQVAKDSVLVYDLSTLITDSEYVPSPSEALFGSGLQSQLTLRNAINAIQKAADDDRIVALYLQGTNNSVGAGSATLTELRAAVEQFRESGKPIYAYDVTWDEREYYLASAANTIAVNPFGQVEMNGLYSQTMYQAEAFSKLGVGVQVTRVGKYKSAVEPLIRNNMSPEEREQTQRILSDIWSDVLKTSAEFRGFDAQKLQAIANGPGLLFGEDAKTQGLVDQIVYMDEVVADLRELTGEGEPEAEPVMPGTVESFRQISLSEYASDVRDPLTERSSENHIALVYAEGAIVDGDGEGLPQAIAGDSFAKQIRELRQDDAVKAIVLRINSPGGSATASEVILREIKLTRDAGKPVIVSMGDVAASGGYWIASYANKIFAEPTTITGSIGVFGFYTNLQGLGSKVGLNWDVVKTGDTADIFTSTRPKSPKEMAILQQIVDRIYNAFLDRVAEGRNLPRPKVAEIAQGRVWSGTAAKELGLVDELGGLEAAIQAAVELAELEEDWQLEEYPKVEGWQRWFGRFTEPQKVQIQDPLTAQWEELKETVSVLQTFDDPQHVYARMSFKIDIR